MKNYPSCITPNTSSVMYAHRPIANTMAQITAPSQTTVTPYTTIPSQTALPRSTITSQTTTKTYSTTVPMKSTVRTVPSGRPLPNPRPTVDTCTALYDFFPNEPTELGFKNGDVMKVLGEEGAWWYAELNGK